jgi:hypothetical protein
MLFEVRVEKLIPKEPWIVIRIDLGEYGPRISLEQAHQEPEECQDAVESLIRSSGAGSSYTFGFIPKTVWLRMQGIPA